MVRIENMYKLILLVLLKNYFKVEWTMYNNCTITENGVSISETSPTLGGEKFDSVGRNYTVRMRGIQGQYAF